MRRILHNLGHYLKQHLKVLLVTLGAVLMSVLVHPSAAYAWKPTMHVYLGEQALKDALDDGKVTIQRADYQRGEITGEVGTYAVDRDILAALQTNAAQYRAGILGPDAYPDILTGQQVIHPDTRDTGIAGGSNAWLQYLWNQSTVAGNNTPAIKAFTVGYLTHAAGDMYGHTFINNFSGGSFAITPPAGPENAIKHIVLEGYVDKRLDQRALSSDFFNASINGVDNFIYKSMIDARPGTFLDSQLLRQGGGGTDLSVPRIYSTLRKNLEADITKSRRAADACSWWDPTCSATYLKLRASYEEAWRDDIDSGLRAWPAVSHEVAKALFFNPARSADTQRAEDVLQRYVTDHLISMSGAPDFVGLTIGITNDIINAITPDFLLQPIRQLKEDLLNSMLKSAIGMSKQELKEYLTSPDKYFDQVMNRGSGENVNLQRFNSAYLRINDSGYTNPSEAFDYRKVPAAYNTVTMSKLILLSQSEVNRLLSDLGSSARLNQANAMLGFIQTLDGDNQWQRGMVVAQNCDAYRKVFMQQAGERLCAIATNPQTPEQPPQQPTAALNWVAATGGQVPAGTVTGGQEPGRTLYICRANFEGGVHPGKLVGSNCNIGYGGREVEVRSYETLVQQGVVPLRWVAATGGQVPAGAVTGGQEPGRTLYICRANFEGGVHPGKLVGSNCNIGYGGREVEVRNYEVLART